ncbi:MAG: SUMF1/EgtB/PvdO family nonheme iron enzyme [Burkholderiales bacterium]
MPSTQIRGVCATRSFVAGGSIRLGRTAHLSRRLDQRHSRRVNRGGSWNNKPANVRSAKRNRNEPSKRNNNLGFRVASTLRCQSCSVQGPSGCASKRPTPVMVSAGAGGCLDLTW